MLKIQDFIERMGFKGHEDLAKKLGVKKGTVSSWSSGDRTPTYDMCQKLLELGMTVEELFGKPYLSSVKDVHDVLAATVAAELKKIYEKI